MCGGCSVEVQGVQRGLGTRDMFFILRVVQLLRGLSRRLQGRDVGVGGHGDKA